MLSGLRALCVTCVCAIPAGAAFAGGSAIETRELRASDGMVTDEYGSAVAIDGDWAVVTAWRTVVDVRGAIRLGRAYVLHRDQGGPNNWGEVTTLEPDPAMVSGTEIGFGASVEIDGDTIAIGAYRDGIDGSSFLFQSGSVWVYQKDQGGVDNWGLVKTVVPTTPWTRGEFGLSMDLEGDRLIVGSWRWGNDRGAAFIYERDAGGTDNWGEVKRLTIDDVIHADRLGWEVTLEGDYAAASARDFDSISSSEGAVVVYHRNEGGADNWGEVKRIMPPAGASDYMDFGYSIDMEGRYLIVAAPFSTPTGGESLQGCVYVYDREDNWTTPIQLLSSNAYGEERFGYPVRMSGHILLIGTNFNDNFGTNAGVTYMFSPNEGGLGQWGEVLFFTGSNAGDTGTERFGYAVDVKGTDAIVGSFWDNTGGDNIGAAYTFDVMADLGLDGDCNGNGVSDVVDLLITCESYDCNSNGIPDECDIANGTSLDANGDGIPDECECGPTITCEGDVNGDNMINFADLNIVLDKWATSCEDE